VIESNFDTTFALLYHANHTEINCAAAWLAQVQLPQLLSCLRIKLSIPQFRHDDLRGHKGEEEGNV